MSFYFIVLLWWWKAFSTLCNKFVSSPLSPTQYEVQYIFMDLDQTNISLIMSILNSYKNYLCADLKRCLCDTLCLTLFQNCVWTKRILNLLDILLNIRWRISAFLSLIRTFWPVRLFECMLLSVIISGMNIPWNILWNF